MASDTTDCCTDSAGLEMLTGSVGELTSLENVMTNEIEQKTETKEINCFPFLWAQSWVTVVIHSNSLLPLLRHPP